MGGTCLRLALLLCAFSGAAAQAQTPAPPAEDPPEIGPDTPDAVVPPVAVDPPPPEQPPEDEPPARVGDKPAAIDLSLLRTRNLSLLYFDPAQTYLTPHV